jgi:hypothetical protein
VKINITPDADVADDELEGSAARAINANYVRGRGRLLQGFSTCQDVTGGGQEEVDVREVGQQEIAVGVGEQDQVAVVEDTQEQVVGDSSDRSRAPNSQGVEQHVVQVHRSVEQDSETEDVETGGTLQNAQATGGVIFSKAGGNIFHR